MSNVRTDSRATLVIGAGELGVAMLRALSKSDGADASEPLHGLLRPIAGRDPSGALQEQEALLTAMGIGIVRADLGTETIGELAGLFAHYGTIICCTGFVAGPGTQRKITAAVLQAGVHRYVPWQFGVDYDVVGRGSGQDVWDEQLDVREMLRGQATTRWTIVSTGMFTSFLFEQAFGVVDLHSAHVTALGSWDYRLTVTTPQDIGLMTAAILARAPELDDRVAYLAGDTFSYAQLAAYVEAFLQRPVTRTLEPLAALEEAWRERPDDTMRAYRLAFARPHGVAWEKEKTFNAAEGLVLTDVPTWLADHPGSRN